MDYNKKQPNANQNQNQNSGQKPNLNNDRGNLDRDRNRTGGNNTGFNKNIPGGQKDKEDKKW